MSAKDTTVLTQELTSEDRRVYVTAAYKLVRLHMTMALSSKGVANQNFNMWCKGHLTRLGEEKQHAMLSLFGLTPRGQLMSTYTHSWRIVGRESEPLAEQLMTREMQLSKVVISHAYASLTHTGGELSLVGVEVNWVGPYAINTGLQERPRRLIMTAAPGTWLEDDFKEWVLKLFKARVKSAKEITVGPDLRLSISAANNIWRWNSKARATDGSRLNMPKRKALLPIAINLIGENVSNETALDVLQDMTPRFIELAKRNALTRNKNIGPHDKALIRRAEQALDSIEGQNT